MGFQARRNENSVRQRGIPQITAAQATPPATFCNSHLKTCNLQSIPPAAAPRLVDQEVDAQDLGLKTRG
jgi:hypothetical protein